VRENFKKGNILEGYPACAENLVSFNIWIGFLDLKGLSVNTETKNQRWLKKKRRKIAVKNHQN
jgi:hypothetical protein